MKNSELQAALQKLPATAEIKVRLPSGDERFIDGLEIRLPTTIPLDKPGLSWSDMVSEAITGVLVASGGPKAERPEPRQPLAVEKP